VRKEEGEPRNSCEYTILGGLEDIDDAGVPGEPDGNALGTCSDPDEFAFRTVCIVRGRCPEFVEAGESGGSELDSRSDAGDSVMRISRITCGRPLS
jgi:hypothetical protein